MNTELWSRIKAVNIVSDDWGMCAWCPTAQVYEEIHPFEYMRTPWSSGTLETPRDMEVLFSLLEEFRGGDDLPCMIQPFCVISSPDYAAIKANGFTEYVDFSLEVGVSQGWDRGDLAAKAREGWQRGVWQPGYHGRAHHFSPRRWVERLREGDEWAVYAFERNTYVSETVSNRLPEYSGMSEPEQVAWLEEGLARFEQAFGFPARAARNSDFTPRTREVLADHEVRAVLSNRFVDDPEDSLMVLPRPIDFEPFLTADHENVVAHTLALIEESWDSGQPAVVSTHRRNYKGFDQGDVARNFEYLHELLGALSLFYPEVVYLCGDEVSQLDRTGYSVVQRGDRTICRNYGEEVVSVNLLLNGDICDMTLPVGETVINTREI